MAGPQKVKPELPHDPAIPLPDVHLSKLKAGPWRGICTPVSAAALFTVAQRCPPTNERIDHVWSTHAMKYRIASPKEEGNSQYRETLKT